MTTRFKCYRVTVNADFRDKYDSVYHKIICPVIKSNFMNKVFCYDAMGGFIVEYDRSHVTIREIYK